MRFVKFPMQFTDGEQITLKAVLETISDNRWEWNLLYFYGVGKAPLGMNMPDFERLVRSSPNGYSFSWVELINFSINIEQTYDCLLVASNGESSSLYSQYEKNELEGFHAIIQAFDCDWWSIGSDELLLKNFERLYKISDLGGS